MEELPELQELSMSADEISKLVDTYVIPWGLNIIFALLIFFVGKAIVGLIVNLVKKLMGKAKMDSILVNFIGSIVKSVLLLFVVIAALDQLGVNTTSLIALIGAAGLAIGLALQGSLQNLASGVMLIVFRPFTDGDFVEAGGATGVVEEIGIFNGKDGLLELFRDAVDGNENAALDEEFREEGFIGGVDLCDQARVVALQGRNGRQFVGEAEEKTCRRRRRENAEGERHDRQAEGRSSQKSTNPGERTSFFRRTSAQGHSGGPFSGPRY